MKNNILAIAAITIAAVSILQTADAQIVQNDIAKNHGTNLKMQSALSNPGVHEMNASLNKAARKAIENFLRAYTTASNASWYQTDAGGFVALFQLKGNVARAFYKKNGEWAYSIQYLDKSNLPYHVLADINTGYYGYDITSVQKVEGPGKWVYLIKLENKQAQAIESLVYTDDNGLQELEN